VHGNLYGTPRESVESALKRGKLIFMDLDVQGGINVKKQYRERAILIFIEPPSVESLRQRLCERNTDSPEVIERRLEAAVAEMQMAQHYDHVVVNHNLEDTVGKVREIIKHYRD
jgi:guanylate kinase